jgi:two-component system response regulator YesN
MKDVGIMMSLSFKVLIVDDEIFVRKGLLEIIPWFDLNLTIVGEADNGQEAQSMIKQLQPDIVITDIRMPILDGLGLIQSVVNENSDIPPVFVVISGFHDFKYAQQALRYGVYDYILKPIDEQEMTAALRNLVCKLNDKKAITLLNKQQSNSLVIETLLQQNFHLDNVEQYAHQLELKQKSSFIVVLLEIHTCIREKQITPMQPVNIEQLQQIFDCNHEVECDVLFFEHTQGMFGMLLSEEKEINKAACFLHQIKGIRTTLACHFEFEFSLYAGSVVQSLHLLHQSYMEANEAAKHKYAELNNIILFEQTKEKPLYLFDIDPALINTLILQLEEGKHSGYIQSVDSIFDMFQTQRFAPQAVIRSLTRCMTEVIKVIKNMEGLEDEIKSLKAFVEQDYDHFSLKMLKQQFLVAMSEAEQYITSLRRDQLKGGIQRVKKYIDAHYGENISLKSIAADFYMNAVYLGRLFRKSYGMYFNEYLLKIRVEEAKKLLRQTDLRMYEISAKIGFQNVDYFVTQFEKLEQKSPTEYRHMLIDKEKRGD